MLTTTDKKSLFFMGVEKYLSGDKEGALSDLNLHILVHIKDPKAHIARARIRFEVRDYKGCITDCVRAGSIDHTYVPMAMEYSEWNDYYNGRYIVTDKLAEELLTIMEQHAEEIDWVEVRLSK